MELFGLPSSFRHSAVFLLPRNSCWTTAVCSQACRLVDNVVNTGLLYTSAPQGHMWHDLFQKSCAVKVSSSLSWLLSVNHIHTRYSDNHYWRPSGICVLPTALLTVLAVVRNSCANQLLSSYWPPLVAVFKLQGSDFSTPLFSHYCKFSILVFLNLRCLLIMLYMKYAKSNLKKVNAADCGFTVIQCSGSSTTHSQGS